MFKAPAIAVCAALLLGSSTVAADAAIGVKQKAWLCANFRSAGQADPKPHQVVLLTLHASTTAAWVYDPATGGLTTLTPVPQDNTNPVGGIGIVVKKNPGGSAERMGLDVNGDGCQAFPDNLEPGNYDIVITVPHNAINTKGTGTTKVISPRDNASGMASGKSATITLHVTVDAKGNLRVNTGIPPAAASQGASNPQ